jgi:hypothetical protein
MAYVGAVLGSLGWVLLTTFWFKYGMMKSRDHRFYYTPWVCFALANGTALISDTTMSGRWLDITLFIVNAFLAIMFYRRNRKNRKKILKLIGEKSKALLAAVADHARKLGEGARQPLPA